MLQAERRSDVELVADMLRIKGSKTAIMYGANLSYAQTQRYLAQLAVMGLIESVDGRKGRQQFSPTQRGRKFLEIIDKLEELMGLSVKDA